jgi:peptidyl-prolyl cis-trans isomerase B (cyclophilin B)
MTRHPSLLALAALSMLSMLSSHAAAADASKSGDVKAVLELSQEFYNAGEPFFLRVSIGNDGDKAVSNPVKTPLYKGFEVRAAGGGVLTPKGKPDAAEPARPDKLSPKAFYGQIVDLTSIYPEMKKPGKYEVRWVADGVESPSILVRMIPKYDPTKEYRATIETDEGSVILEFFPRTAPIAVKAFVDMANSGVYDGMNFYEVRPDAMVSTGDAVGDGSGSPPFLYPQELGSVPVVTGTVVLKPVGVAPPANGSQIVILLRPEPSWSAQVTVLGQVVQGLDVIQKISRLPSSQMASRPFYKPLKDVRIRKITVAEKQAAAQAGG